MPLFSSRPQPSGVDGLLQVISMGECDDHTIRQLQELVTDMGDEDVKSLADVLMTNLVKYPDDIAVLTGSVKALEILPFMPKARNEFIITLLLSLLKSPVNKKDALQRKTLKTEIIKFMLYFVNEDDQYAKLMMAELIAALDDSHGSISSSVFHTLQRLAADKPEYFERYSASLIKELGSINKMTRAESAKLIGILAKTHPEYVCKAMPFLQSLASFYPDSNVKRNANEAYQIIWKSMKKESSQAPVVVRKATEDSNKGFADIVKLNSGTPNVNPEAQFTDEELKEIIELTRKEFKSDAEAILDSLGVGHLNVKGKHKGAKAKPAEPAAAPKAKKPAAASKPDKDDPGFSPTPRSGIASAIKREPKESPVSNVVKREPKESLVTSVVVQEPKESPVSNVVKREPKESPVSNVVKREPVTNIAVQEPKGRAPPPANAMHEMKELDSLINNMARHGLKHAPAPADAAKQEPRERTHVPANVARHEPREPVPAPARQEPKESPPMPGRPHLPKCPRCGGSTWAKGQLCDTCAGAEFDRRAARGHYDMG